MITVTFECTTAAELYAELTQYLNTMSPSKAPKGADIQIAPEEIESSADEREAIVAPVAKKPRAKREKPEASPLIADMVSSMPTDIPALTGAATRELVHAALQEVNVAKGLPAARDILKSFDAVRMSDLKAEQYADFVSKCREVAGAL